MKASQVGEVISSEVKTESTCIRSEFQSCSDVLSECPILSEEIIPKPGYQLVMGSIATHHTALKYLFSGHV